MSKRKTIKDVNRLVIRLDNIQVVEKEKKNIFLIYILAFT